VNNTIAANKTYPGASGIKWTRLEGTSIPGKSESSWNFTDEKGGNWNGVVRVEPVASEKNRFTLSIKINRSTSAQLPK
jgi:hypothetical protein